MSAGEVPLQIAGLDAARGLSAQPSMSPSVIRHRNQRATTNGLSLVVLTSLALAACGQSTKHDVKYFLEHPNLRSATLERCREGTDAPQDCAAARAADEIAARALMASQAQTR
jgi:hypothetical protein